jgi:steroid 5-alpha reductase family enzyme
MSVILELLALILGLFVSLWTLSIWRRDASVVDPFWGAGFAIAAWFLLVRSGGETIRALLVPVLVTLWGVRLSLYLLWRNWGEVEDYRYREMRARNPRWFPLRSLATVFGLQAVILWFVSLVLYRPIAARGPAGITLLDVAGVCVFGVGLLFESVGDLQLARFRANPENRGRVLDSGLWRYTRHPNYFGDALVWWGLFLIGLSVPGGWWALGSPVLMTALLMKVSGVALLEVKLRETRPQYREYMARTSAFFPLPPRSGS